MYILAVTTSYRNQGNTELLLDEVLRGMRETSDAISNQTRDFEIEKIRLPGFDIKPCRHCDYCIRGGECSIQDDMQGIFPKLIKADGLIFASPIYFMGHCAQAKLLIDRCQAFWARRYILKRSLFDTPRGARRGIFIAAAGTGSRDVFTGAKITMKWFFDSLEVEYWENLLFKNVDEKGAIRKHPTALLEAFRLGCRAAKEWN